MEQRKMIKYESSKNNRMKLGDLKESHIYVEYSILLIQRQATQLYHLPCSLYTMKLPL